MTHELIVGLGFGDEGKGTAVDYFCATRDIKAVIRYNGGPQAAHNVVQPDGRHHTFAQFGSGSFHGVPTHLSQYMLVNPFNLVKEDEHLRSLGVDIMDRLTVASGALLITPYHVAANRTRETLRGTSRHGSTGQGVGETRAYDLGHGMGVAPRIGDLRHPSLLYRKLLRLYEYLNNELPMPDDLLDPGTLVDEYLFMMGDGHFRVVEDDYVNQLLDSGDCVFEGAQGVLLDERFGFHPHTTWTDTTTRNAVELLDGREAHTIGVTRTYHTRHGAGPFPTEDYETNLLDLPEAHNGTGEYQGAWRTGALDLSLLNYAFRACAENIDSIMVTHMDRVSQGIMATCGYKDYAETFPIELEKIKIPNSQQDQVAITEFLSSPQIAPAQYDILTTERDVRDAIEMATGLPIKIYSTGPTWTQKVEFAYV